MKKHILSLAFLASCLPAAFGMPSFDPFTNAVGEYATGTAYATGSALYHQTNGFGEDWALWAGQDSSYMVQCVDSNLTYSGFPASFPVPPLNRAVLVPGSATPATYTTGQHAALNLAKIIKADPNNQVVNTIYASFLMQVPLIGNLNSKSPTYFGGFATNSEDQTMNLPASALKLFARGNSTAGSSTTWGLGIANNSGAASAQWVSGLSASDILFVVVDYEFGINGNPDVARMWVNPDSASFGAATAPSESASISITGNNRIAQAADFYLLARSGGNSWGALLVSDLRIGDTWGYVTGVPEFTATPVSLTNDALTLASFSAPAIAAPNTNLGYQWQLNGVDVTDGPNISGSQTATLTITNACATNAGTYSIVVTNPAGSVSASALLVLNPPLLNQQPVSQGVPPGGSAAFSVAATGVAPLTYQWYENYSPVADGTSGSGTLISGATTDTLHLSNIAYGDSGATFYCMVTDGGGVTSTSSNATLSVQNPAVASNPQNVTTNYGATATFSVTAAGTPPFTYQWYFNGIPLSDGPSVSGSGATVSGATSATLAISGVTFMDVGSYHVVISGPGPDGSATSADAALAVNDPCIVTQPAGQTNQSGSTATLSVAAQGSPMLSYQWEKDGAPLYDGGNVSGAQSATLSLSSLTTSDTGSYSVTVYGGSGGAVTSQAAALAVLDPITIVSGPQPRVMRAGDHIAFAVGINGTWPAFQWQLNGSPIEGATESSLALTNLQAADAGTYSVVVTNLFSTASASATLSVSSEPFELAPTNLVVVRVGDGAQALNDVSGNTLYLDQIATNGAYLNTTMIPDSGPSAIITAGAAAGQNANFLTLSADHGQLNFVGFAVQLPYAGNLGQDAASLAPKGIGSVDAVGTCSLVFTNTKIYSPGRQARGIVTDGNNNYWTVGNSGGLKWLIPTAAPNTIPTIFNVNDLRAVDIVGTNLWASAGSGSSAAGVGYFSGLPTGAQTPTLLFNEGSSGNPNDFAVSPDGNTVYVADNNDITSGGGIQRWDNYSGYWALSYTLGTGASSSAGASGLTVDFSHFTGGGYTGSGAVIYATTAESADNRLIAIADTAGQSLPVTVLASAGANQLFRGVRFGPTYQPAAIAVQPQTNVVNFAGSDLRLWVAATGTELSYQWQFNGTDIAGATGSSLVIIGAQAADAGSYTCVVSNRLGAITSSTAIVQIDTWPAEAYPAAVLADHPMAYWRLDEASGAAEANDYVDGHYGYYYNAQLEVPGYSSLDADTAAEFGTNGVNNSYVGNIEGVDFSTPDNGEFSVEAWVKGDAQSSAAGIVTLGYGNGGEQFSLDTGGSGNAFRFLVRDMSNSSQYAAGGTALPDGEWHHLVGVCDQANGILVLYVDGVSNAAVAITPGAGICLPTAPVSIGSRQSSNNGGNYDANFQGTIDEVALYGYALSPGQVAAHYNAAPPAAVAITVTFANGQMVLSWPGSGTLQWAPEVSGPWNDLSPAPSSPYAVTPSQSRKFFRLRIQ